MHHRSQQRMPSHHSSRCRVALLARSQPLANSRGDAPRARNPRTYRVLFPGLGTRHSALHTTWRMLARNPRTCRGISHAHVCAEPTPAACHHTCCPACAQSHANFSIWWQVNREVTTADQPVWSGQLCPALIDCAMACMPTASDTGIAQDLKAQGTEEDIIVRQRLYRSPPSAERCHIWCFAWVSPREHHTRAAPTPPCDVELQHHLQHHPQLQHLLNTPPQHRHRLRSMRALQQHLVQAAVTRLFLPTAGLREPSGRCA